MSDIKQQMVKLQEAIYTEDYFVELYHQILADNSMTFAAVAEQKYSDRAIVEACQDFWESLPDTGAIRREPFFELCTLAEFIFDSFDEDDNHVDE